MLEKAQAVIEAIGSYTEVSPSGTGFKIFARGELPPESRCSIKEFFGPGTKIEFFDHDRYFAVTGHHLAGTPLEVCEVQDAISALMAEALAVHKANEAAKQKRPQANYRTDGDTSHTTLEEKIKRGRAWLAKCQPAIANQGGHNQTFRASRAIVHGLDLGASDTAFSLLSEWNLLCDPVWCDRDLWHKIHEADIKPYDKPRGYLLLERPSKRKQAKRGGARWAKETQKAATQPDDNMDAQAEEAIRQAENGEEGGEHEERRIIKLGEKDEETGKFVFSRSRVLPTARAFSSEYFGHPEALRIVNYRGEFLTWTGSHFRPAEEESIRSMLSPFLHDALQPKQNRNGTIDLIPFDSNSRTVEDALKTLRACTYIDGETPIPSWRDHKPWRPNPATIISCQDALLNLEPFLNRGDDPVKIPHTPAFFARNTLPYAFSLHADCPRWKNFLEFNLEGDLKRIAILQEWFGLNLVHDTRFQKCFLLEGEGANGKSVILTVLESLLGVDNFSNVSLEVFGDKFALCDTIGKLANIAAEVGGLDKTAEGVFKRYVSADRMDFEPKFRPRFQAKPTARVTLAYNTRPRFYDRTGAMWRRLIVFPLFVVLADGDPRRNRNMTSHEWWQDELPGVLNWSLEGLRRLYLQRDFTKSEICDTALMQYKQESNPARRFLEETYELALLTDGNPDRTATIPKRDVYRRYTEWTHTNGHHPLADYQFSKEVKRAFKGVEEGRPREGGERVTVWIGLRQIGHVW
ncbi:MAG: hypothetical protein K2X38_21890 [Gemmataceae bacterium]|nr:hypothetical protein [Gemmataceae bacterium]